MQWREVTPNQCLEDLVSPVGHERLIVRMHVMFAHPRIAHHPIVPMEPPAIAWASTRFHPRTRQGRIPGQLIIPQCPSLGLHKCQHAHSTHARAPVQALVHANIQTTDIKTNTRIHTPTRECAHSREDSRSDRMHGGKVVRICHPSDVPKFGALIFSIRDQISAAEICQHRCVIPAATFIPALNLSK